MDVATTVFLKDCHAFFTGYANWLDAQQSRYLTAQHDYNLTLLSNIKIQHARISTFQHFVGLHLDSEAEIEETVLLGQIKTILLTSAELLRAMESAIENRLLKQVEPIDNLFYQGILNHQGVVASLLSDTILVGIREQVQQPASRAFAVAKPWREQVSSVVENTRPSVVPPMAWGVFLITILILAGLEKMGYFATEQAAPNFPGPSP